MQPCEELKNMLLHHYGQFETGSQADTIQEMYSLQDGVTIIGNDPEEWFDDSAAVADFMQAGGSSKMDISVRNLRAFSEGSVGWTMDRVTVKLPNGAQIPVRHTRIFHKEQDAWKLVHLHVSIAVPNERIGE